MGTVSDYGDVKSITKAVTKKPAPTTTRITSQVSAPYKPSSAIPAIPTAPVAPAAPQAGPVETQNPTIGGLTFDEIQGMIGFLEAKTGLTKEQLAMQDSMIGRTMYQLLKQLNQNHSLALDSLQNDLAGRGILRSGIANKQIGILGQGVNQQASGIAEEAADKKSQLALEASGVEASLAAEIAQTIAAIEQANLEPGVAAALKQQLASLNLQVLNNLAPTTGGGQFTLPVVGGPGKFNPNLSSIPGVRMPRT
jgi:hypothetical protein